MFLARIELGQNPKIYEVADREATVIGEGHRKRVVEFKRVPWSWRFVSFNKRCAAAISDSRVGAIAAAKCKLGVV